MACGVQAVPVQYAVELNVVEGFLQPFDHVFGECCEYGLPVPPFRRRQVKRFGQANNAVHVFSAAAHVAFLSAAVDKRMDGAFAIDIDKTDAFWTVKFVRCAPDKK